MSAKAIVVWGILGVLVAMAIVIFMPKSCQTMTTEGFAIQQGKCIFNAKKYADLYPDLKKAFEYDEKKLRDHYIKYGLAEGRTPCGVDLPECKWSSADYSQVYADVAKTGIDPLQHYKQYGIFEGRSPCPAFPKPPPPPPPPAERYVPGKCPAGTKSFIDKNGNQNCCAGHISGNTCEGKLACTFSGNISGVPHCSTFYNA
jgi:hypothetical protein